MRRRVTGFVNTMIAAVIAALLPGSGRPAGAADQPALSARLAGNTLSAVAYVTAPPGAHSGGLERLMLQAYLGADGSALVRQWVPSRNSYSALAQTRWSLTDDALCIALPSGSLCAKVHIWGPRIAGIGTRPYVMLDGDLRPGNAIGPAR